MHILYQRSRLTLRKTRQNQELVHIPCQVEPHQIKVRRFWCWVPVNYLVNSHKEGRLDQVRLERPHVVAIQLNRHHPRLFTEILKIPAQTFLIPLKACNHNLPEQALLKIRDQLYAAVRQRQCLGGVQCGRIILCSVQGVGKLCHWPGEDLSAGRQ